ncbi:hypothetical protein Hanom_Chr09g00788101 [Helianthus anomalus]
MYGKMVKTYILGLMFCYRVGQNGSASSTASTPIQEWWTVFKHGEVIEVNGDNINIASTSGKTVVAKSSNVYPKDAEAQPCGVDDMTKLAYLHEPGF